MNWEETIVNLSLLERAAKLTPIGSPQRVSWDQAFLSAIPAANTEEARDQLAKKLIPSNKAKHQLHVKQRLLRKNARKSPATNAGIAQPVPA